ncbi:tetratricopeptide repeat protein [Methylophilaceae bacterium]|nr:tetratricopeptide repeat protein [Methylophilaceae bacterium]MDB4138023.1 tetratricopeptide repeat protein [Methylophilaceae bacterium]MDC1173171.1 tetratricopeptide repeat protein [Methylophilaceae bacterium]
MKFLFRIIVLLLLLNTQSSISKEINFDNIKSMVSSSPSRALVEIDLLLESDSNNHNLLFLRAVTLTKLEQKDLAIKTYISLIEKFPKLPEPYNNLAVLYAEQNKLLEAKQILEKALKTNNSYSIAHINLGDVYTRMASDAYRKAFELDESPVANNKLQLINELFSYSPNMQRNDLVDTASKSEIKSKEQKLADLALFVERWKTSWEDKDLETYFSSYSKYFKVKGDINYKDWKRTRTEKIINKKEINIQLTKIKYKFKEGLWFINMSQAYNSGNYSDKENKTLVIINESGDYKIIEENTEN